MPIYDVQGPDGRIYSVEAPEGASEDKIFGFVRAQMASMPQMASTPQPAEGIGAALKGGFKRYGSSLETALESIIDPQKAAERGLERGRDISKQYAPGASLERVKQKYEQEGLFPAAREAIGQIPAALAEQTPNIATAIGGARLGAMAGAPIGGPVGALIGGGIGAAAAALPQLYASNLERQAEEGKQVERSSALGAAVPGAVAEVASQYIPLGRGLIGKILGPTAEKALAKGTDEAIERAAKESVMASVTRGAGVGLLAEIPTEVSQQMLERLQAGLPLTTPDALAEYGEAAYGAGLVGLPFGVAGRTMGRPAARAEFEARQQQKMMTETPPAVEAPTDITQMPGGYAVQREEIMGGMRPETFNITMPGAETPLASVDTEEEAQKKLESFTQIRQNERESSLNEIEKINEGVQKMQSKLDYMEATGQANTEEYTQLKANLPAYMENAAQKSAELHDKIEMYGKPLEIVPVGEKQQVQEAYKVLDKAGQTVNTFPTLGEAEAHVKEIVGEKPFTEELQKAETIKALEQQLIPAMQKFGLKDVGLKVVENIENNAGGAYFNKLMRVAMSEANPLQTMRHESVHALKDLGFFTPQQWKALEERAKKEWIKTHLEGQQAKIDGQDMTRLEAYRKMGLSEDAIIEEAIADAFAAYDKGQTPPPGLIAQLFKRLKQFFANLGQAMRGAGFESADDIFQRIERGELKPSLKGAESAKTGEIKYTKKPASAQEAIDDGVKRLVESARKHRLNTLEERFDVGLARADTALTKIQDGIEKRLKDLGVASQPEVDDIIQNKVLPAVRSELKKEERYSLKKPASDIGHKREATSGRYVGAPDWVGSSPQQLTALRKKLKRLAKEGEIGRLWYENSSKAILELTGGDKKEAEKIVGLIAIYSPNATVPANTSMALNAYYQYKAGQPINAGFSEADKKAEDLLRHNKEWSGIKTNSFYQNLMVEIDPSKLDPGVATMDMWMALAFDYGMKALDQGPKYKFAEREIQRLAKELGWDAHQVQAAIWTAMKGRIDPIRNELKKKEIEVGIGEMYDKDGKQLYRVKPDRRYDHFRLAHKMGMDYDLKQEDIAASKYDFSDAIEARTAQMSWEATPGEETGVLPGLLKAPINQKFEYLDDVTKVLTSKEGKDKIAEKIGLPSGKTIVGFSAWKGDIGAGKQTMIGTAMQGQKEKRDTSPEARNLLNLYSNIKGFVLNQEAVVWHIPVYDGSIKNQNGIQANFNRALNYEEMSTLYKRLHDKFDTWEIAPGYTDSGFRVLNFTDIPNKQFHKGVEEVLQSLPADFGDGMMDFVAYKSVGDYISNDWKEAKNGEQYAQQIESLASQVGITDPSGLLKWATDLRSDVEAVNERFSKKYGWGKPNTRSDESAVRPSTGGGEGITLGDKRQEDAITVTGVHYGNIKTDTLDGKKYGTGLRGGERRRLEDAFDERIKNRTYFYIKKDDGTMPKRESGVGTHAYTQTFKNILGPGTVMSRLYSEAKADSNEFETSIIDAGYDGYAMPSMGMMVILNHNVPVDYRGTVAELGGEHPKAKYSLKQIKDIFNRAEKIKEPPGVEAIREQWIGGVSGVGDRDSMYDLYRVDGSKKYIQDVQDFVREELGDKFNGYRLMSNDELEELQTGAMGSQFVSFTLNPDVAKAFKNIPAYADKTGMSVIEMELTPEHVNMIGHPGELELVVDYGQGYNPSEIKVIEKYSLKKVSFATPEAAERAAYKKAPPSTPEFKLFFGASQIMDEGRPQVMYHASPEDFDVFRENKPIFLSSNAEHAASFAKRKIQQSLKKKSVAIYPLWARAETPFDYENDEHVQTVVQEMINQHTNPDMANRIQLGGGQGFAKPQELMERLRNGQWDYIENGRVQGVIKSLGFDSFYVREGNEKNLAVYGANQVKSVTGNTGDFSTEAKSIKYSLKNSGFHAGDLRYGKDTTLGKMDGGRSTGHFGTGVYFVSNEEKLGSARKDRPVAQIDLSQYKLAKPLTSLGAQNLHDGLKIVNRMVGRETREELQADLTKATSLIKNGLYLDQSDSEIKKAILTSVKSAIKDRTDDVIHTSKYLDSASTRVMKALGFDGVDVRHLDNFDNTQYGTVVYRESVSDGATKYSLPNISQGATDAINRVTTTRESKGFMERILGALSPENYTYYRQQALNRYEALSVADKIRAQKIGNVALMADQSAETAALMSDLHSGVAASVFGIQGRRGGVPVFRNGITTVDHTKKGLVEVLSPLAKYGDPKVYQYFQFYSAVKRGARLFAEGRERLITPADQQHANELAQKFPEFEAVRKDWVAFNDAVTDYLKQTGVLSAADAARFKQYADYIPFYRQLDGENTMGPNIFQSLSGVKKPKTLKGGEAPLADFMETIVRNTHAAITAGMKNTAEQRVIKVGKDIGIVTDIQPGTAVPEMQKIKVLVNGVKTEYQCSDPMFAEATRSLNMTELPFMSFLSAPANLLRNLITREPGFIMTNLLRDSMSAYVTSGANITPIAGTAINFAKAMKGNSPAFEALMDAGIIGGYEFSANIEQSGEKLTADLMKKSGKGPTVLKPFTAVWDGLEKATTASDAATRMAVYERVLAETGNEAEALSRALEVMNFNRKGSSAVVRILTAAVPFLNARMQGLDLFYRSMTGKMNNVDAKEIQAKFFTRGMMLLGMSTMYYFAVAGDPEYEKQEQETKDNNWIIPGSGIRIPIPFEVGILFKTIPERIAAYTFGNDTGKDFLDAMKRAGNGFIPVSPSAYIPQTFKPIIEAMTNYSFFTQREIVGMGLKDVAPEYQVGPGTSAFAEFVGKTLGLSPLKVDYVFKGYTGTMGMYAVDLMDVVMDLNSDSPKPTKRFEQLPIIKRFAADPEARGNVTNYYQLKDSVDTAVRTMNLLEKSGNPEEFAKYVQDNAGLLAFRSYVNDLEKTMKELRDMKKQVLNSPMSGDEKRDTVKAIGQAENNLTVNIQTVKKVIESVKP